MDRTVEFVFSVLFVGAMAYILKSAIYVLSIASERGVLPTNGAIIMICFSGFMFQIFCSFKMAVPPEKIQPVPTQYLGRFAFQLGR